MLALLAKCSFTPLRATTALVLLMGADAALAATTTAALGARATVGNVCSVGATNLNFGDYVPRAGLRTGNSTISVRCTSGTAYVLSLNIGATSGGSYAQRVMGWGTGRLRYNLFTTPGFTTVLGNGTAGTATLSGTGAGMGAVPQNYVAYGRLPDSNFNRQALPNSSGNYQDTITVTATY
jgi:spore coat protein U-like protein